MPPGSRPLTSQEDIHESSYPGYACSLGVPVNVNMNLGDFFTYNAIEHNSQLVSDLRAAREMAFTRGSSDRDEIEVDFVLSFVCSVIPAQGCVKPSKSIKFMHTHLLCLNHAYTKNNERQPLLIHAAVPENTSFFHCICFTDRGTPFNIGLIDNGLRNVRPDHPLHPGLSHSAFDQGKTIELMQSVARAAVFPVKTTVYVSHLVSCS